ncbi:Hypothetical predicted protein, partial [Podarcis lilfordi]
DGNEYTHGKGALGAVQGSGFGPVHFRMDFEAAGDASDHTQSTHPTYSTGET